MKDSKSIVLIALTFLMFIHNSELVAQNNQEKLSKEEISITIDSIGLKLENNYVIPNLVKEMKEVLNNKLKEGIYFSLSSPFELAKQLTLDLQSVSKDKHLMVVYNPEVIARELSLTDFDRKNEENEWTKEFAKHLRQINYGFEKVEILESNIGYMNLTEFVEPKYSGETLTATMNFLSNTNAIIIDLRENDGGSPLMVQLLASYFFSSEPVHLADHYNQPRKELSQSWTLPYLPGKRRPEMKLYILTSKKTFSAAEAFSYQLKCLGRATIIGETTAGGAHLTGSVITTDKFYVRIPQGRTTSSVTNEDWEGVGVKPDIEVDAKEGLQTAHNKAIKDLEALASSIR